MSNHINMFKDMSEYIQKWIAERKNSFLFAKLSPPLTSGWQFHGNKLRRAGHNVIPYLVSVFNKEKDKGQRDDIIDYIASIPGKESKDFLASNLSSGDWKCVKVCLDNLIKRREEGFVIKELIQTFNRAREEIKRLYTVTEYKLNNVKISSPWLYDRAFFNREEHFFEAEKNSEIFKKSFINLKLKDLLVVMNTLIEALGNTRNIEIKDLLYDVMETGDPLSRIYAIQALVKIFPPGLTGKFSELLSDSNGVVRYTAVSELDKLKWTPLENKTFEYFFGKLDPGCINVPEINMSLILEALKERDLKISLFTVELLGELKLKDTPDILKEHVLDKFARENYSLREKGRKLIDSALTVLGKTGDRRAIKLIIEFRETPDLPLNYWFEMSQRLDIKLSALLNILRSDDKIDREDIIFIKNYILELKKDKLYKYSEDLILEFEEEFKKYEKPS